MAITKNPDGTVTMSEEEADKFVNAARKTPKPETYYTDDDIPDPETARRMSDDDLESWLRKMDRKRQEWEKS